MDYATSIAGTPDGEFVDTHGAELMQAIPMQRIRASIFLGLDTGPQLFPGTVEAIADWMLLDRVGNGLILACGLQGYRLAAPDKPLHCAFLGFPVLLTHRFCARSRGICCKPFRDCLAELSA